jgi:hypothetical protein
MCNHNYAAVWSRVKAQWAKECDPGPSRDHDLCTAYWAVYPTDCLVCGVILFTYAAEIALHIVDAPTPLPGREARHETCEFHQVRNAKERMALPNDDFRVRADSVCPLRRDRANRRIVDPQQKPLAGSVVPLAHADQLSPAKWVKWMRHPHKLRRTRGRVCILG